jgi:hypothetical protein
VKKLLMIAVVLFALAGIFSMPGERIPVFNGLDLNLGNLSRLSRARTRSISPENFSGEKGMGGMATEGTGAQAARDFGRGWKISPSIEIQPKQNYILADIQGPEPSSISG